MKKDMIKTIYQNFLNSQEYEKSVSNIDFDISGLQGKICEEDMLKLEETISSFSTQNGEALFKNGFRSAWKLFNELSDIPEETEPANVDNDKERRLIQRITDTGDHYNPTLKCLTEPA